MIHYLTLYKNSKRVSRMSAKSPGRPRTRTDEQRALASIWSGMMYRCYNRKARLFKCYGGRGIKVWPQWHTLAGFAADVHPRPSKLHSLDRVDNDLDYGPMNWRWATKREQSQNARHNINLTFLGETLCVTEWARRFGVLPATLFKRLERGWPIERALKAQPGSQAQWRKRLQPN